MKFVAVLAFVALAVGASAQLVPIPYNYPSSLLYPSTLPYLGGQYPLYPGGYSPVIVRSPYPSPLVAPLASPIRSPVQILALPGTLPSTLPGSVSIQGTVPSSLPGIVPGSLQAAGVYRKD
ncbi:unnamed protein product [Hermetia illucens]|uniref:Uncharacterized protein n=1 Tax=Hermetia illucens TaxID=343691 RepID=A0A7R8UEV4_HERIL|nr:tetra-peptide repeat homeobox protein 1-like [Hermetia illucens]CAD7079375.1 unnamed protein product [Hermetia illucens]